MSKTSYVGVNNIARQCKSIYVGVNNIARKITKAYVGDNNGKARLWWDESGIIASNLPVGQIVKLMEGGVETEYIIVNQGIPKNSSLYDASCNGTWLLRKDIYNEQVWNTGNVNEYESSSINIWLNGDYFNSLGTVEQATIKEVKIPGMNGLSCKIFLLSGYEVGWTSSDDRYFPHDGAKLSYFTESSGGDSKRIAYLNGSATVWWLRSRYTDNTSAVWRVYTNGNYSYVPASSYSGIRPALILPSTALFDKDTKILKG